MSDDVCINEEQYDILLDKSEHIARVIDRLEIDQATQAKLLERVASSIFGNGHVGLRTEIEVIKATMGLKDSHIEQLAETKLGQKIDWKWIGMILLQFVLLALMGTLHF